MHFVDAHGRIVGIRAVAALHPFRIVPLVAFQIEHHAAGLLPVLGIEGKWIGLEHEFAMRSAHFKFVVRALVDARDKNFPDAGGEHFAHGVNASVPVIPVTDDAYPLSVGSPDGEMHAGDAVFFLKVRAEFAIDFQVVPLVKKVDIHFPESRAE